MHGPLAAHPEQQKGRPRNVTGGQENDASQLAQLQAPGAGLALGSLDIPVSISDWLGGHPPRGGSTSAHDIDRS
jgi:hypothetical protein